ncbi:FGGY family carbohydrate kinase, partial [Parasutterella excrementihominis]
TYGTGGFLLMNTGSTPKLSDNRLLSTIGWTIPGATSYALEGSVFVAGAVVQWLREGVGLIDTSAEIESLARQVKDNGGVYLIPAFVGLGAPYWDPHARGLMIGLTRGTTRAHIARAALESITFQCNDVLRAMMNDAGARLTELRVDGGASENDLMMQFQADISGVPVVRPEVVETTALGAAYLAGLGCGVWKSTEEIEKLWRRERTFEPTMSQDQREFLTTQWGRAVARSKGWEQ